MQYFYIVIPRWRVAEAVHINPTNKHNALRGRVRTGAGPLLWRQMVNVARVMHLVASSTTLYGVQKTLEKDGIPTARSGIRWATPVL